MMAQFWPEFAFTLLFDVIYTQQQYMIGSKFLKISKP
jgi:hypothetical protein